MGDDINRDIRKSQLITPFGPGAIYDKRGQSFVVTDTTKWERKGYNKLSSQRLRQQLGAVDIYEPGTSKGDVLLRRFPKWLFCSKCRRMYYWRKEDETGKTPKCRNNKCEGHALTPIRFVQICPNGHMDDVSWSYFTHWKNERQCKSKRLKFISDSSMGGGLNSLRIECIDCNSSRNLGGLLNKNYLQRLGITCNGNIRGGIVRRYHK